ncbi:transposase [Streptomyces sp. NPDC058308]|uniref:transposase n=1 Tax=Streptomyces sp. NPDC058308 TaxID=3346440 RepID=UPI0036E754E2
MAFRKDCLAMRLRDEVGVLFEDEQFVEAFPSRGGPGLSPGMLALVSVLQYAENLTDRQAAEQVKGRIDWKYALSLELEDPGFDFSVLCGFRARLIERGLEEKILDILLQRARELDLPGWPRWCPGPGSNATAAASTPIGCPAGKVPAGTI